MKEKDTQVQEAQTVLAKMHPKRPTTGHVIVEIEDKERILKAARERQWPTREFP